ncbi:hypothetical protein JIG36_11270 [Actinoplanes sp. LDG1-06]|uniref:Uncharacterized protein n=1 Tax=Paractinoplanes ovalisporus TaxID=2810368 RepID=A0ABS2A8G8_9ACTN|nr:hypothetical protein [Actinoplanes ovalisporus]MBM2616136.1 hypothetical protein [Actinoplanes ovalisporus]
MRRRGLLKLAAGLPLAGAGLGGGPTAAAEPPPSPRGRVAGLLAREDHLVRPANQARLRGLVLRLSWKDAQLTPGASLSKAATDALDRAEAVAPGYPFLKLRLVAGAESPDWALHLDDGPLTEWVDPEDITKKYTVPQWWQPEFLGAYEGLLTALADELDGRPRWAEVTVSATCTIYAEPCVKQLGVAANRGQARDAGYTDAKDQDALRQAMDAHHRILTPLGIASSVAYNPWQTLDDAGAVLVSPATTRALMDHQRTTMGAYGVWANNSLSARWVNGEPVQNRTDYDAMYEYMTTAARAGHPVQFQTATLAKIQEAQGSVYATASWAARRGALSVELPRGWEQDDDVIDLDRAGELNRLFAGNTGEANPSRLR